MDHSVDKCLFPVHLSTLDKATVSTAYHRCSRISQSNVNRIQQFVEIASPLRESTCQTGSQSKKAVQLYSALHGI